MILCDLPFLLACAVGALLPLFCFGMGIKSRSELRTFSFRADLMKGALAGGLIVGVLGLSPHIARLFNLCDALGPMGYGMLQGFASISIALGLIILLLITFIIIGLSHFVRLHFIYARLGLMLGLCAGYFFAIAGVLLFH